MKRLAIVSCLIAALLRGGAACADDAAPTPGVTVQLDRPHLLVPNRPLRRSVGIGLAASSAFTLILGFVFVGLAHSANDQVLTGGSYHPNEETRRDRFEIVHATFFTATVGLFASGMVLIWDR